MKRAFAYIDRFNLFYGSLKHPNRKKYRWLNPEKLIREVYSPQDKYLLNRINFYTARVVERFNGDTALRNQQIYFNALKTIKNLHITEGNFIAKPTYLPKYPLTDKIEKVQVLKTEEKGSDVNLASHLVLDASQDNFDIAIVITNDTDLFEPIKIISGVMYFIGRFSSSFMLANAIVCGNTELNVL